MIKLYYSVWCLKHIIDIFSYILKNCNILHTVETDIDINSDDLWIGIWNDTNHLPKKYISINTEPLSRPFWRNNLKDKLIKSLLIIDFTYINCQFYEEWKVPYVILPFGYCDFHKEIYIEDINKDIDILFYGAITLRRKIFFDNLKSFCFSKKLNLVVRENNLYNQYEKSFFVSKSKIVLSVKSYDEIISNDLMRLAFLLTNKVFVIGEKHGDEKIESKLPIVFYTDFSDLCEKIVFYIENETLRKEKANECYENFKTNFNMIKQFIESDKIHKWILHT